MVIILIFVLALVIRFLYFPDNIYFGFDQARDAYHALDIFHGDLKIVGPSTTFSGLNHGVLHWYILSPLYFFSGGSIEFVSAAFRIFNGLGVFLIFYLGKILFNKKAGFLSALFFAISFEQSQFAIYIGNPTLGSLSVPLMYLGLAMVAFKNIKWGLPLAFLGLGFSIQFQFALFYLIVPFILLLFLYKDKFFRLPLKIWGFSALVSVASLSTFILAEFKYQFRMSHTIVNLIIFTRSKNFVDILNTYLFEGLQMIKYNVSGNLPINLLIFLVLIFSFVFFFRKKETRGKIKFLSVWFFSLFLIFYMGGGIHEPWRNIPLYYPNVGASVALLLFVAFLISKIQTKFLWLGTFAVIAISLVNLQLIKTINPHGSMSEINAQQGMLFSDEKKILDYLYKESKNQPFTVKAVTMPFDINTTWSYLFEFYGQKKNGYLPLWNGKNALGFPGKLKVQEAQEGLPDKRYVIIEPLRGVPEHLVLDFLKMENYFTKVIEGKKFGEFIVQKRIKI